ncbi:TetR/AcrR family transcriptional regulator [Ferrimonas aestuarii]|uniref:TetR/AcrR family transcriptional regulator n=1 Tax=Ferrimonas aestuarii TaxID=2569539 RepID=UPI00145C9F7B|nr:TetR/AcrR family transcriptional regulator [Ferrimonas aestuarii]
MHCPVTAAQQQRCQKLLDAAENLISNQGIVSFKVSQVVSDSGLSNNSFYKLFESKEDLLVCCFLRNATANQFADFERLHPNMTAMEKVLIPIIFTFEATYFSPSFNLVRQVAVNSMVWKLASPEKNLVFKKRINQYWHWVTGYVQQAVEAGELDASEEEVLELSQAITFYLSGALSAFESGLIDKNYLQEKRITLFKQLKKVFMPYRWRETLKLADFERIGMRVHMYYSQNRDNFNSCERCQKTHAQTLE